MTSNFEILVTGASGLIGNAICEKLLQEGISFLAVSRKSATEKWKCLNINLEKDDLEIALKQFDFKTIIHCAALIPNNNNSYEECYKVNSLIDNNIIEYSQNSNIDKFIFISSTNLYGDISEITNEEADLKINNEYSKSKFETESKLEKLEKIKSFILRVNAPYSYKIITKTVLKIFIENAFQNKPIIYSGNGNREQDFTHVDDIAAAVLLCSSNVANSGVYNISSGTPISMKNLANLIKSVLPNCTSTITNSGKADNQENYRAKINISKAKIELNWSPKITLDQGIKEWIKFLSK